MKAILEGTAAELRQFFRTGTPEDLDQPMRCMFCGCTDFNPCPGGCSWVAPNVCSRCAEMVQKALVQDAPGKAVLQGLTMSEKPAKTIKAPGEVTPDKVNIDDFLIPAFDHDRKLKSSYKTLFFTEIDNNKTVLSYCATKLYVNRAKVLGLPYPIPRGYFGRLKSGTPSNRVTAIRFYRAYLAEQKQPGSEPKPEPEIKQKAPELKSSLLSGKNGAVVLAPFAEAERFDYIKLPNRVLGPILWYENSDGRVAIKYYGHGDIVFISREQVEVLKKMDKDALAEYIGCINAAKQFVLKKYIESLKDDAIGALGMVKTYTRVSRD